MSATAASRTSASPAAPAVQDKLALAVIDRLKGLVDGNCAKAADLVVGTATRIDRHLVLHMAIHLGWASRWQRTTGKGRPPGMTLCRSRRDLDGILKADCQDVRDQPITAETLRKQLEHAGPAEAFRTLKDTFKVRDVPGGWYIHDQCSKCVGRGRHRCEATGCTFGKVRCTTCQNADGRQFCYSCHGSGRVTETHWNGSYHETRRINCRQCGGQGRFGSCPSCHGSGTSLCVSCSGTAEVGCTPCGQTGWFLEQHWAWITGSPIRSYTLAADAPTGFKSAFSAVALIRVPGILADTTSTAVSAASAGPRNR